MNQLTDHRSSVDLFKRFIVAIHGMEFYVYMFSSFKVFLRTVIAYLLNYYWLIVASVPDDFSLYVAFTQLNQLGLKKCLLLCTIKVQASLIKPYYDVVVYNYVASDNNISGY